MRSLFFTMLFLVCLACTAHAASVNMAIGLALPPYIISEENRGMEYDIVKTALAKIGYELQPSYFPFARIIISMKEKLVDGVMTVNEQSGLTDVYYTDSHITYQNVAITLKKDAVSIPNVQALGEHSIAAFQNAVLYLGDDFKKMAENNNAYREFADQDNQVALLFHGRYKVYVGDINIFNFYKNQLSGVDTSAELVVHEIFPKTHYKIAFHDQNLRDKFNASMREIRESGEYDRIIQGYLE